MVSKQIACLIAGMLIATAGIGCVIFYNNTHHEDITSDATVTSKDNGIDMWTEIAQNLMNKGGEIGYGNISDKKMAIEPGTEVIAEDEGLRIADNLTTYSVKSTSYQYSFTYLPYSVIHTVQIR